MKRAMLLLLCLWISTAAAKESKNVILMIADGWGYNQIIALNDWLGVTAQVYEDFPVRVAMSTYSWDTMQRDSNGYSPDSAWTDWEYMLHRPTDSAAAATAMSTGVKVKNGELSMDTTSGLPLLSIQQYAEQLGKSTGVITSVTWSHATPAGFASHNVSRKNQTEIAQEMINASGLEVIMGGGNPYFDDNGNPTEPDSSSYEYVGGSGLWNALVSGETKYKLIQTRAEFQALAEGITPERVCGTAQIEETLQQKRRPDEAPNYMTFPYTIAQVTSVPTLAEMTRGALNVLDNNPQGFFIMIEGGAIDWANHENQGGRLIEEMTDYSAAVEAVIQWVENKSSWDETLLIVTGDHETGYLWGPDSGKFSPIVNNGACQMPGMVYYSKRHSNSLIPVFAKGNGSERFSALATKRDPVRGAYLDNTDIARGIFENMGKK
jgi:alkaline phosphatase